MVSTFFNPTHPSDRVTAEDRRLGRNLAVTYLSNTGVQRQGDALRRVMTESARILTSPNSTPAQIDRAINNIVEKGPMFQEYRGARESLYRTASQRLSREQLRSKGINAIRPLTHWPKVAPIIMAIKPPQRDAKVNGKPIDDKQRFRNELRTSLERSFGPAARTKAGSIRSGYPLQVPGGTIPRASGI